MYDNDGMTKEDIITLDNKQLIIFLIYFFFLFFF